MPQLVNEKLLRKAVERIVASRQKPGYWVDSEREKPEESMVFKGLEALNMILGVRKTQPHLLGKFKLSGSFIKEEINYLYNSYRKEGFFPSPYSYTRENFDCPEFASFCVQVLIEILGLNRVCL